MMNEFETTIILSKYDRVNNGIAKVWSNDTVVLKLLKKLGATFIDEFNYELPLVDFAILPKRRTTKRNKVIIYPTISILENDSHDKETIINYTRAERKRKILHIFTEDEHFLARCKKYYLPYKHGEFISNDDFNPFGKRAKLSEDERASRGERMREAKKSRVC